MKKNTSKPLLGRQLISECPNIWQPLIVYRTQYDDMRCVFGRNQYKCQLYTLSTCYYCYLERKNYWYISGIIFMLHIIKYNKIQVYKHQSIFESLYNNDIWFKTFLAIHIINSTNIVRNWDVTTQGKIILMHYCVYFIVVLTFSRLSVWHH